MAAELRLGNVSYTTAETLTLTGTGANSNGAGALSNSGTSIFAGAITVASNATIGSGGGTLTLTGGILKDGTTLTLAGGGVININTVGISGSSPNSDLIVNGTTANLNATNTYNGPTSVMGGGNIVLGVNNAIPNNSAVTLGGLGSTTGILTMGTLTNAIAQPDLWNHPRHRHGQDVARQSSPAPPLLPNCRPAAGWIWGSGHIPWISRAWAPRRCVPADQRQQPGQHAFTTVNGLAGELCAGLQRPARQRTGCPAPGRPEHQQHLQARVEAGRHHADRRHAGYAQ